MGKPFLRLFGRLSVILLLFSVSVTCIHVSASSTQTNVFIDPPSKEVLVNQTFSISVSITNVTDLWLWNFKLWYTTAHINAINVIQGPFLKANGAETYFGIDKINNAYNSTHGFVSATCNQVKYIGVNGSGVLATVSFKATSLGNATLRFVPIYSFMPYPVRLNDPKSQDIPCTVTGGTIEVKSQIAPYGPQASFTVPPTTLYAGKSITFNASDSKTGCNGTHEIPITQYDWDFGDGATLNETDPIADHVYKSFGNYTVTLTVYAPGATPETDTTMSTIIVITSTMVFIDPPLTEMLVNLNFTVSVTIANVTNLFSYEFKLYYNNTVLDGISIDIPMDHFLTPATGGNFLIVHRVINDAYNSTHGLAWVSATLLNPELPKNGSGILAKITFKATALGSSNLTLYYPNSKYPVKLGDAHINIIPCAATNGTVEVKSQISPFGPHAEFAQPMTKIIFNNTIIYRSELYVNEIITFNASLSKPGCNGTHAIPINLYSWNFGDDTTLNGTTQIANHTYTKVGNYTVTLTVYAPGAIPETDTYARKIPITVRPVDVDDWTLEIIVAIIAVSLITAYFSIRYKLLKKRRKKEDEDEVQT